MRSLTAARIAGAAAVRCQPRAADAARVRPVFTSLRYGDAGYGQLSAHCAVGDSAGRRRWRRDGRLSRSVSAAARGQRRARASTNICVSASRPESSSATLASGDRSIPCGVITAARRSTARKHYAGVLMQQGRVQLDADWNEQLGMQCTDADESHRRHRRCRASRRRGRASRSARRPAGTTSRSAPAGSTSTACCASYDPAATYTRSRTIPNPEWTAPVRRVRVRRAAARDLPDGAIRLSSTCGCAKSPRATTAIREKALEGPDTADGLQTSIRSAPLAGRVESARESASPLSPPGAVTCGTPLRNRRHTWPEAPGTLNARTRPPRTRRIRACCRRARAITRLENQLYRVEVHTNGPLGEATFKWARDSGGNHHRANRGRHRHGRRRRSGRGAAASPSTVGRNPRRGIDAEAEPNPLAQIDKLDPATREITLKTSMASLAGRPGLEAAALGSIGRDRDRGGRSVRRFENWIDLEGGIQVRFSRTGDFRSPATSG